MGAINLMLGRRPGRSHAAAAWAVVLLALAGPASWAAPSGGTDRGRAPPGRRRVLVNMVVAQEEERLLKNLQFFLDKGATPSAAADVTYRVTLNGVNPRSEALVAAHNVRSPARVRLLKRPNAGFDFGGHLDALAEEAACCGDGACAPLTGGVPGGRANHARCYAARYPDVRAACAEKKKEKEFFDSACAVQHFYDHGRAEGRRVSCAPSRAYVTCGGAKTALNFSWLPYDAFVGLNVGVRGPFYPSYMPPGWHWTSAFLDKLTALDGDGVALVGTSIACLSERPPPRGSGEGPRVEGFAFALERRALIHVLENGTSFSYHARKVPAIVMGEYALSLDVLHAHGHVPISITELGAPRVFSKSSISAASRPIRLVLGQDEFYRPLLDARRGNVVEIAPMPRSGAVLILWYPHRHGRRWNIGSLLVEHNGVDFRDRRFWNCNPKFQHPTRAGTHHGLSVHPLEVLFHKPVWHTIKNYVSVKEMESLTSRVNGELF